MTGGTSTRNVQIKGTARLITNKAKEIAKMYEPAWALQAAVEEMGYDFLEDVPQEKWGECFALADIFADES